MRSLLLVLLLLTCCSVSIAQTGSREERLAQMKEFNSQIQAIETKMQAIIGDLIAPSPDDIREAESQAVKVVRLNPRETYGRIRVPTDGGAFFSFSTESHDYQKTAQLVLEGNSLSTGFAGADYGLIGDLGDIPLSTADQRIPQIAFLMQYRSPGNILDARVEQHRSHDYIVGDLSFHRSVKFSIGRTYVLRAISFGNADVAVAFRTIRKDTDGSVIIFWKTLAEFPKPTLDPNIKEPN